MLFGSTKQTALVIKDHVIRYVTTNPGEITAVHAFGEHFLRDGMIREGKILQKETLGIVLEECIERWGLNKGNIFFPVPDASVLIRHIDVPKDLPDDEVKSHVFLELGGSIQIPFDDPIIEVDVLGIKGNKKQVVMYAAPESIVSDYTDAMEDVKLEPVLADLSTLAVYRLFHHFYMVDPNQHTLCIQFDIQQVNVGIFHKHKLILMRHLKMDLDLQAWKISKDEDDTETLEWDGDMNYLVGEIKAMVTEVESIINYYQYTFSQDDDKIEHIILAGDHPHLREIEQSLAAVTEMKVDSMSDKKFGTTEGDILQQSYYLNLGLALNEVK